MCGTATRRRRGSSISPSLFNDPAWGGLKAVEEGRVHELSEWLFVRYPGPRVVLGLEQLRPLMYPQE